MSSTQKNIVHKLIIFILVITLYSCGTTKKISTPSVTKLSKKQEFDFKYNLFDANQHFLNGSFDKAESEFLNCLKIDSSSAVCYYRLASIFLFKKDFQLAENFAKKSVYYSPNNVWYSYLLGNLYNKNDKTDQAIKTFQSLIDKNPKELDYYLNLVDIQLKNNRTKDALKTLDQMEQKFGISEMTSVQKHNIYLTEKDNKKALFELEKLSNRYPNDLYYKRLIADFYFKINKINEAESVYNNNLKTNPQDGYSFLGLAQCYFKKNEIEKAMNQLKLAFNSDEVSSDVKVNLLIGLLQNIGNNKKFETQVYELTEILIKKYPNNPDVNTIYADFLLRNNLLLDARKYLRKVIEVRKDKYMIWEQLLLLENQFQDWKALHKESSEALKYFPNQSFLYFFNGFSSFQLKQTKEALKSFEFGLKLTTKEDPLRKDYMTFIAECKFKLNEKKDAYKMFDELLSEYTDNIMVLNNYAYYLSLDNKNLDKALQMSEKTIDKEPNNPTYLDTYAWILFQKKQYTEALKYIEQVFKYDTNPGDVVIEHYGDILYHNNNLDKAIEQWKNALKKGKGSGLLQQKIDEKKYIE